MVYWDNGSAFLGVDDGTNTTDILRFWSDGTPYTFVFTTIDTTTTNTSIFFLMF